MAYSVRSAGSSPKTRLLGAMDGVLSKRTRRFVGKSFVNLSLRGSTLLCRFLLAVFMARYLSLRELGVYGLFNTSIVFAVHLLGFDFYLYSTREILAGDHRKRLSLIKSQFAFYLGFYVISIPLLSLVFLNGILPFRLIVWFFLILVVEHVSQEMFRLFMTLSRPFVSNAILFVRSGLWVIVIVGLWSLGYRSTMNLSSVWIAWTIGGGLAILIGAVFLARENLGSYRDAKVDLRWILVGVKASIPFFISTVAAKTMELSSRYLVDAFMSKENVGIFTLFNNIANLSHNIVFTVVTMVYLPRLLSLYYHEKIEEYKRTYLRFSVLTVSLTVITSAAVLVGVKPLLWVADKTEFAEAFPTFIVLLAVTFVINLTKIPHVLIYTMKEDWFLMSLNIFGAVIHILVSMVLIRTLGLVGAAIAFLVSSLIILLGKSIRALQLRALLGSV